MEKQTGPIIQNIDIVSHLAKTKTGEDCIAFQVSLFSEPTLNELYLVSRFWLTEGGIAQLKKMLGQISQKYPKVFEEANQPATIYKENTKEK